MFTTPVKWTWEKMKDITLEWRKVRNAPEILEWLEYLYNEMKKRENVKTIRLSESNITSFLNSQLYPSPIL